MLPLEPPAHQRQCPVLDRHSSRCGCHEGALGSMTHHLPRNTGLRSASRALCWEAFLLACCRTTSSSDSMFTPDGVPARCDGWSTAVWVVLQLCMSAPLRCQGGLPLSLCRGSTEQRSTQAMTGHCTCMRQGIASGIALGSSRIAWHAAEDTLHPWTPSSGCVMQGS